MSGSGRIKALHAAKRPHRSNGHQPRPYSRQQLEIFWRRLDEAYPPADEPEKWLSRWERGLSGYRRIQAHAKRTQIEAIVALALYGGLRRNEIFNLEIEEMHPEHEYVVVRGARKNREAVEKPRIVPWNDPLYAAVRDWLALRERLGPDHDRPWLSLHTELHYRKPMRHRQFEMLLHNVGRGFEFRRMRHTFATEALRAGMPVEILQRVLGHATPAQTMQYAQLVEGDILRAAEKVEERFTRAIERTRGG